MDWRGWFGRSAAEPRRWLMVDVESSGLDTARDRLLAIAVIGLQVDWQRKRLAVDLADSFEVVLRQEQVSGRANILLHGIGAQQQMAGVPAADALRAFAGYVQQAPVLGFHVAFDQALICRDAKAVLGLALPNRWLDIAQLCAVTHPEVRGRSLDEWMAHFGIRCAARHQAMADSLSQCDLLLRIWPRVAAECGNWRDVERLAARHRWLART